MENFIKKISSILSFAVIFFISAAFYFSYKGFEVVDGKLVLVQQVAEAAPQNGIATVLPADLHINASDKYALGSANAPFTLYEYSSLGCPHCADLHADILPFIEKDFVEKGMLRIIFVNFPLDKKSAKAALLANCMIYDNYHNFLFTLFTKQRSWWLDTDNDDRLLRYAAENGLSYDEAQMCLNNDRLKQDLVADREEAIKQLHLTGTPAMLITGPDGNELIHGAQTYEKLKAYLDARISRNK